MRKKLSIILSAILVICTVFSASVVPAGAANYKNKIKVASKSAILINLDTGQTVYEKDCDTKRYPASTTKIMTYIIVAEHVNNFKRTKVPIKQSVLDVLEGTGSSMANIGAHVGKKMSVLDLLYSMMVPSGNDAAVVLADYVGGGSIDKFVSMMNQKAKDLGCENTHFMNPDGLHDKKHYTTARDLAKITQYALTLPEFSKISNTTTYYVTGDEYPLVTTNYLIDSNRGGKYYYQYAKGIKTGTTDEAGHCLVTSGSADGYSYLGVFLKSPYNPDPAKDVYGTMLDAKALFRWALTKLELNQVASSETPMREEKINLAWGKNSVQLVPEKNINAIVPKDFKESDVKVETTVPESVDAPVKKGDIIGKAVVYYNGPKVKEKTKLAEVNLVSSESVERSGILYIFSVIQNIITSRWFIVVVAAIVLLLILYIIISSIIRRRNRRSRRSVRRYRNF